MDFLKQCYNLQQLCCDYYNIYTIIEKIALWIKMWYTAIRYIIDIIFILSIPEYLEESRYSHTAQVTEQTVTHTMSLLKFIPTVTCTYKGYLERICHVCLIWQLLLAKKGKLWQYYLPVPKAQFSCYYSPHSDKKSKNHLFIY